MRAKKEADDMAGVTVNRFAEGKLYNKKKNKKKVHPPIFVRLYIYIFSFP